MQLYQAGETAFAAGEYDSAMRLFESSYELSQRPGLLYNMGHCADRLRRDEDAIRYFTEYLERAPQDAANRDEAERRLRALHEAEAARRAEAERAVTAPVESTSPSTVPASTGGDITSEGWFWPVVGGGAVLIGGVVMLAVALDSYGSVVNAQPGASWLDFRSQYEQAQALEIAGWISIAVGAAAASIGIVLVATTGSSTTTTLSVGPSGLSLSGSF